MVTAIVDIPMIIGTTKVPALWGVTKRKRLIMGYVNDTAMSQFIPAINFAFSLGTWTPTLASNVVSNVRTAGAASCNVFIPILIPSNLVALKGSRLKSIDVWYSIATADLTDFATVEIEAITLPANATLPTATTLASTQDALHNTAALRKAQQNAKMTITVTTPVWIADLLQYVVNLVLSCAATSVVTFYGALIHYDARE
jgi:hypothetical protein